MHYKVLMKILRKCKDTSKVDARQILGPHLFLLRNMLSEEKYKTKTDLFQCSHSFRCISTDKQTADCAVLYNIFFKCNQWKFFDIHN